MTPVASMAWAERVAAPKAAFSAICRTCMAAAPAARAFTVARAGGRRQKVGSRRRPPSFFDKASR